MLLTPLCGFSYSRKQHHDAVAARRDYYSSLAIVKIIDDDDELIHLQYTNTVGWYTYPITISIAPLGLYEEMIERGYILSPR